MIDYLGLAGLAPLQWAAICGVLGLCVGSFLNVVAHRLPVMMQRQWDAELAEIQGQPLSDQDRFNLLLPTSHCPHCKHSLRWWQNIPVVSYLLLRARCGFCKTPISARYPAIELATAAAFAWMALAHGPTWESLAWMGFLATLIALAAIDLDTYLLPDSLTLPLLWAGLLFNLISGAVALPSAVLGAALGYGVLWLIYQIFKLTTGKEGMGYGDFKLLAALGAWLGVGSLLSIALLAAVSGICFGLALQVMKGKSRADPFPFGPSLVLGALLWMAGVDVMAWMDMLYGG